jgi:hypothetical protein
MLTAFQLLQVVSYPHFISRFKQDTILNDATCKVPPLRCKTRTSGKNDQCTLLGSALRVDVSEPTTSALSSKPTQDEYWRADLLTSAARLQTKFTSLQSNALPDSYY